MVEESSEGAHEEEEVWGACGTEPPFEFAEDAFEAGCELPVFCVVYAVCFDEGLEQGGAECGELVGDWGEFLSVEAHGDEACEGVYGAFGGCSEDEVEECEACVFGDVEGASVVHDDEFWVWVEAGFYVAEMGIAVDVSVVEGCVPEGAHDDFTEAALLGWCPVECVGEGFCLLPILYEDGFCGEFGVYSGDYESGDWGFVVESGLFLGFLCVVEFAGE